MTRASSRRSIESSALLLGRVDYGEADLIVQLFTQECGKISALARGARRSQKRFHNSLEPMHTLRVEVSEPAQGQLYGLRASDIEQARMGFSSNLDALIVAGKALKWIRSSAPAGAAEPQLWSAINLFLNGLHDSEDASTPEGMLAAFGLRSLELLGWGLNLESCVSCGKTCPQQRPAWVSPERGGLICRSCGGGPFQVGASSRESMIRAARGGELRLEKQSTEDALRIVDRAFRSHLGVEGHAQ